MGPLVYVIACEPSGDQLGALLIVLIRQAIRTLHLDQNYEWIIIGGALILAVVIDQSGTRLLARRLARGEASSPPSATP